MANPQIENGFTRIANELLGAILKIRPFRRATILLWILRYSYGFRRKFAPYRPKKIAEETEIFANHIRGEIRKMVVEKILIFDEFGDIGIQKNYETWDTKTVEKATKTVSRETKTVSENTKLVSENLLKSDNKETKTVSPGDQNSLPNPDHTYSVFKENLKKEETKKEEKQPNPPVFSNENPGPPFSCEKVTEGGTEKIDGISADILPKVSVPTSAKKPKAKAYSVPFKEFLTQYPMVRPGSISKAFESWVRLDLDNDQKEREKLMEHVLWSKANDQDWGRGCVPMPVTYINQKRWEVKPKIIPITVQAPKRESVWEINQRTLEDLMEKRRQNEQK